jgi:hypothetical protein
MERLELEEAISEGLSLREIADRFGFASTGPASYWLEKYGLKTSHVRISNPILKVSDEELSVAVSVSTSVSGTLKYLSINISSHGHFNRRIKKLGLDTSHFQRMPVGFRSAVRKSADEILVRLPAGSVRIPHKTLHRALQDSGVLYKCVGCGNLGDWLGEPLSLEIDHIDGDWLNNLRENLRYLCPNCHGITPTHRNKKRK